MENVIIIIDVIITPSILQTITSRYCKMKKGLIKFYSNKRKKFGTGINY